MLTVITPAASTALTTPDAVKADLGAAWTRANVLKPDGDDGWLEAAIARASAAVCSFCRRSFAAETVRETVHLATLADVLPLTRWPLVSIASVTEGGTLLSAGDTEADEGTGLLYRLTASGSRQFWRPARIVVEYRAGYVLPGEGGCTLPRDIEHAAILLVLEQWHGIERDPRLKAKAVEGVGSETYWIPDRAELPPAVVALLAPHRQWALG
ncbi:hypothetical protein ACJ41P_22775 [Azospirillum argentinense]|uniref:PhiE125 gp8 family phage protein n=1 Tax=Azospirillum argentinense TaxID=2970906 RepID=A0ABW8VHR5_9PROT